MIIKKLRSQPFLLAVVASVLIILVALIVSHAQSTSSPQNSPPASRRYKKFVNLIPAHLPIAVKINNGDSENWEDELSVEVTNTSSKPIYLLELYLIMPDVKKDGVTQTGFSLRYGRGALIDFSAPIQPDDVPIKPGEAYTFKIPESDVNNWKKFKAKNNLKVQKLHLIFVQINYGDRTGFNGTDGRPIPNPARACNENQNGMSYADLIKAKLNHPQLVSALAYSVAPASFF